MCNLRRRQWAPPSRLRIYSRLFHTKCIYFEELKKKAYDEKKGKKGKREKKGKNVLKRQVGHPVNPYVAMESRRLSLKFSGKSNFEFI